jgi:hypothetical protein
VGRAGGGSELAANAGLVLEILDLLVQSPADRGGGAAGAADRQQRAARQVLGEQRDDAMAGR